MRIVRGMLLKGNGWTEIVPEMWPMALFTVAVIVIAVWRLPRDARLTRQSGFTAENRPSDRKTPAWVRSRAVRLNDN